MFPPVISVTVAASRASSTMFFVPRFFRHIDETLVERENRKFTWGDACKIFV